MPFLLLNTGFLDKLHYNFLCQLPHNTILHTGLSHIEQDRVRDCAFIINAPCRICFFKVLQGSKFLGVHSAFYGCFTNRRQGCFWMAAACVVDSWVHLCKPNLVKGTCKHREAVSGLVHAVCQLIVMSHRLHEELHLPLLKVLQAAPHFTH